MSNQSVKGTKRLSSANSPANAVSFLVESCLRDSINTAEVVLIKKAEGQGTDGPASYAAASPLVCQTDAFNQTLSPALLPKLPFFRPQAGKAAIVMDPQPGDKAVAVFMKRDSSGLSSGQSEPVQPGSFRSFDQADGFLINGYLGEKPEIWLHLNPQSGDISLSTKAARIEISCRESGDIDLSTASGQISLSASSQITLSAPLIQLNGQVAIKGNLSVSGEASGLEGPLKLRGGLSNQDGNITNQGGSISNQGGNISNQGGTVSSNNIVLDSHRHSGVESGASQSGPPQGDS